jgi:Zn-dependent protease with chaperone function
MRPLRAALLCLTLSALTLPALASETPAEHKANVYAQQELDAAPPHGNIPDYSLSPADLAKSQHLGSIRVTLHFVEEIWGLVSLLLLLYFGVIAWIRDVAVRVGSNSILQKIAVPIAFIELIFIIDAIPAIAVLTLFPNKLKLPAQIICFFASLIAMILLRKKLWASRVRWAEADVFLILYTFVGFLVSLPLDLYGEHLQHVYGLSVQSWASWFGDQAKSFALGWIIGGLLLMLLFWVIRKLPKRWWLLFWGFSIPIILFGIFVSPYIEPLFNKYEPLQKSNPALVARLEEVVAKGHMDIPPERMFLMKASEKTTTLNADVEGFGHSKRVVVWDTTIAKMTPDQILLVFGHESGHYVLHHIELGLTFAMLISLITLFLGYHFVQWAIAKFGAKWGVPSQTDWSALAVLLLGFSLFSLVLEPIQNTFSRTDEHAADIYGQEVVHGLVADPQTAATGAFSVLGAISYADPNPNQFYEFWTYSHPAIGRRAAFGKVYDPWAPGMESKYFKK